MSPEVGVQCFINPSLSFTLRCTQIVNSKQSHWTLWHNWLLTKYFPCSSTLFSHVGKTSSLHLFEHHVLYEPSRAAEYKSEKENASSQTPQLPSNYIKLHARGLKHFLFLSHQFLHFNTYTVSWANTAFWLSVGLFHFKTAQQHETANTQTNGGGAKGEGSTGSDYFLQAKTRYVSVLSSAETVAVAHWCFGSGHAGPGLGHLVEELPSLWHGSRGQGRARTASLNWVRGYFTSHATTGNAVKLWVAGRGPAMHQSMDLCC